MTAEELWAAPQAEADLIRELDAGELIEMSPPGTRHGIIAGTLAQSIGAFAAAHRLGRVLIETGFLLQRQPDTLAAPDLSFVRTNRLPEPGFEKFFPGPPDLAVEIVSPSDSPSRLARKVRQYLQAGASLVWVVDPGRRQVDVYRIDGADRTLRASDVLTAPSLLPGWSLPLADLFN